ncbi:sulfate permease [Rhizoclosmatium globosum]|uniref:Sulfate permease n=1 Tax=Rhizoclosmatium globosum TaxID=329046 RepID=A0A1Y2CL00_9FUNG|nr:sulfate permease [Rhizoclosmatium globosum]|eukprot:ORY47693.1 sulfate permease [Rhizoclosmatium globosum]
MQIPRAYEQIQHPETQIQSFKRKAQDAFLDLPNSTAEYFKSLFPIFQWIHRYNSKWFLHDLIAGMTVTLVVIPQAIGYSTKLANLPAQFGLYTSFVGCLIYAPFATSKDVTIGPTAVLSLLVGHCVTTYIPNATTSEAVTYALTLGFWSGLIELFIGIFRWGIVTDFVPIPVIAGFTSGAAVQIIIQQAPSLLGIKGVNTTNAPYQVLADIFNSIGGISKYDAIFGLTALVTILIIKHSMAIASRKVPGLRYIGYLCYAITLVVATGISYALRGNPDIPISIVKSVPWGLSGIQQPNLSLPYAASIFPAIPSVFLVSLLEHIAVVKTYGRINGYNPDSNQEIVAIGLTNVCASFVGGFPATGSFSRSAIKSATGVKTPLGTFYTGILVIVCLFTLTNVLYYIPNSVLAAIVITAISDLFVNFKIIKSLWEVEIFDFISFSIGFVVTCATNIENAIYASVAWSLLVLLIRVARPNIKVLVRTNQGHWIDPEATGTYRRPSLRPIDPTGILVFKIDESLTYPNSGYFVKRLKETIIDNFEYTPFHIYRVEREWAAQGMEQRYKYKAERSWNDNTEQRVRERERRGYAALPKLRAIVLDFSSVSHVDFTGLQALLDAKDDAERYAGRAVPFHFANVRKYQLNALVRVHGTESGVNLDATPGAEVAVDYQHGFQGFWKSIVKRPEEIELKRQRESAALGYFHFSVDDAPT